MDLLVILDAQEQLLTFGGLCNLLLQVIGRVGQLMACNLSSTLHEKMFNIKTTFKL